MNNSYEIILGSNTNQWWVYDNTHDVYIDPPAEVLDYVATFSRDLQEQYLESVVKNNPDWLGDKDHWYVDIDI